MKAYNPYSGNKNQIPVTPMTPSEPIPPTPSVPAIQPCWNEGLKVTASPCSLP